MGFTIKKRDKGEGSKIDAKRNAKGSRESSADEASDEPSETEHDKKHGDFQDADEEAKHQAGQDMIDAIKAGEPLKVFEAHRRLHKVHLTTPDDAEGGGDDMGGSPDVNKKSSLVDAVRGMPLKTGV